MAVDPFVCGSVTGRGQAGEQTESPLEDFIHEDGGKERAEQGSDAQQRGPEEPAEYLQGLQLSPAGGKKGLLTGNVKIKSRWVSHMKTEYLEESHDSLRRHPPFLLHASLRTGGRSACQGLRRSSLQPLPTWMSVDVH